MFDVNRFGCNHTAVLEIATVALLPRNDMVFVTGCVVRYGSETGRLRRVKDATPYVVSRPRVRV
jgi:hypothetical protein